MTRLIPASFSTVRARWFRIAFLVAVVSGVISMLLRLIFDQPIHWFGFIVTVVLLPMLAWVMAYVASGLADRLEGEHVGHDKPA